MRKITFVKSLGKIIVSEDSRQSVHDYVKFMISQIEIVDSQGNVLSPAGAGIPDGNEVPLAVLAGIAILCVSCYLLYYYFSLSEEHDNILDNTFTN